nr:integrase, catalytic region, zinc finger, CCHC-type, peptidase aspartic, catalytic [Tanacetum cinerariifolium]
TSNALHNAIMEAGGKDRPPMLAPVDACPNVCKMWKAIERLKQGESINVQDLETKLYWEFRKFTSRDGESLESYYSRFYKMINELVRNQCDVTNHQVNVQFLLQLQPEWKRSQQAATKNRDKEIFNSPPPIHDQEPTMVAEDDEMSKDKDINKLMALISLSFKKIYKPTNNNLRTSSNTSRANQDNSLRINKGNGYDNQRIVDVAEARENVEQADWRDDTNDELDDQELEAHYMYMAQIQEVDQDDDDDLANERDLLASLIEKLKCEIDDSKNQMKMELFAHQDTISILSQEKVALIKFYKTRKDKEIDKVIALENKVKVLDNIVYKTDQSVQTMNMLNRNCKTSFAKAEFLMKAQRANPRLYDIGLVKFGNDQIEPILGYGDLVQGTVTIKRVYYVEGLNHNLFFVGQFCDAYLEVAFWKSTCYICDLKGNDLLTGSRGIDLYSITLQDTSSPNLICLMAKATSSQAWLWHRHLSHLNFDTINLLLENDIVIGLPKLKFFKDHLCSFYELGKANENLFKERLPQAPNDGYNFYTWTYVVPCG